MIRMFTFYVHPTQITITILKDTLINIPKLKVVPHARTKAKTGIYCGGAHRIPMKCEVPEKAYHEAKHESKRT